jgi:hypothetical protein
LADPKCRKEVRKNNETEQKALAEARGSVDQHLADRAVRFSRTLGNSVVERPNGSRHLSMLTAAR